ncbi:autotransporter outer membrane beta-barrel domain-containing protein [Fusobacterium varium]|uniref:autotransporter outer membrane beta-barrel domain-containing protein n=1 Tax=Fusobacterium varium TaxID=856 RepID=UPI00242DAEEF|nr:autotransporter outer membrane beta-barrel domain-containing protein [Fusobacterium varium]
MRGLDNNFKRIFKRKVNFTTSVLISFLISGSISFGVTSNTIEIKNSDAGNYSKVNYPFINNQDFTNVDEQYIKGDSLTNIQRPSNSNWNLKGIVTTDGNNIELKFNKLQFDITEPGDRNSYSNQIIRADADSEIKGTAIEFNGKNTKITATEAATATGYQYIAGVWGARDIEFKNHENLIIETTSNKNAENTGIFMTGGATSKIDSQETTILVNSLGNSAGYGIRNDASGSGQSGVGGNIEITGGKTVIAVKGENGGKTYGIHSRAAGEIKIGGNSLEINSVSEKDEAYGIMTTKTGSESAEGKIYINSANSKITAESKVSSKKSYAVSTQGKKDGYISIEGNNHIEAKAVNTDNAYAVYANVKGKIEINKENREGQNRIIGRVFAEGNFLSGKGEINLNLNGKDSFLIGNTDYSGTITKGIINLGVSNKAVWKNENNSKVTNFVFDNGITDMTYDAEHQTITLENISGNNGTFIMDISGDDINQENGKTDFLKIENADQSQKHFIKIGSSSINGLNNYDFDNKNPDNAIWIADANTNIIFEGEKFESIENIYNYTPELDKNLRPDINNSDNGNNWYITGIEKKENEVTETIEDDMTLYYMNAAMARIEMDTLHKRLGDIRNYKEEEGTWARVLSGQMEYDKSGYLKNNYTMVQAGYDKSRASKNGIWFTGFGIHHRKGKTDFRNGDGENRTLGISLYKSWSGYEGQYFDIIGKYSHIDNEYKSFNKINEKMEADYNTWSGSLSIEYGKKKWSDNKKWYIQPNTQLNYTYVNGQNYKTSSGVRAEQKNINSLIGKAGIYAGHKSNHFIKAAVLHEFMGDYGVDIKGKDAELRKRVDGKDSWFEIGIGGDFKVGKTDSMNIYYEIERTYGSDFETNWQVSIGMRYRFNKLSDLLPVSNSKPKYNSNIKYSLNGKNHFTFDNSNLTEDGKKVIRIISEEINKNNKKGKLTIEGHTDSIGTAEYNQKLSEKRAKSVEKEFKENLKTEINYETKGYGKNKPTADNSTPEGRAKNRRVDIKFE